MTLMFFNDLLFYHCATGKAVDMSYDHKPEDELELARIKNAGGKVTMDGRVNGGLNLSRAIGKKSNYSVLVLFTVRLCFIVIIHALCKTCS